MTVTALGGLMFVGRHFTFQADEWDWLLHRRGTSLSVFLRPHNEHLSALPILTYKTLFALFGATSTFPFRSLAALLTWTCAILLFVLIAPRVGSWIALAPAAVLLFFGPAWNDILWGFQIGYLGSVAAGLGCLLTLQRGTRRADAATCLLLIASLSCSSIGLPVLVGVAIELALSERNRRWRRLWVVAVPAGLYVLWYARYGISSAHLNYVHFVPLYAFHGLAAVAGSLTGLTEADNTPYAVTLDAGTTIAVLMLLGFAARVVRGPALSPRFWAAAATALAFWIAAALSFIPGREANQSRYTFPIAPFVVIATAECFVAWRGHRRMTLLIAAGATAAVASNLGFLSEGAKIFNKTSRYARAELGGLEVARGHVAPSFAPETMAVTNVIGVHNMTPITAGPYFSAIDSFGSPADRASDLLHEQNDARQAADFVLSSALAIHLSPARGPGGACARRMPTAGQIELASGPGTIVLHAGRSGASSVQLRRFSDSYRFVDLGRVARGAPVSLSLPQDGSTVPWHVRISSTQPLETCSG
jgi:hypothetical protein